MSNFTIYVVVLFVAINAAAGMIQAADVDETIGIDADVDDNATEDIEESAETAQETGSGSSGIVGLELFATLGNALHSVLNVLPAFQVLADMGVPQHIITAAKSIVGVIIAFDVLRYIRGGGT